MGSAARYSARSFASSAVYVNGNDSNPGSSTNANGLIGVRSATRSTVVVNSAVLPENSTRATWFPSASNCQITWASLGTTRIS